MLFLSVGIHNTTNFLLVIISVGVLYSDKGF